MRQTLKAYGGGWVRWRGSDFPYPVLVCFEDKGGRLVVSKVYVSSRGEGVSARLFRLLPLGRIETWVNQPEEAAELRSQMHEPPPDLDKIVSGLRPLAGEATKVDLRLMVPDTFRYEDGFYRQVAAVYQKAEQFFARPAREIADENGIPLATVQRWVKDARRKGILPAGRRGKAG